MTLKVPATSSVVPGAVVPIPTLPPKGFIKISSAAWFANTLLPCNQGCPALS